MHILQLNTSARPDGHSTALAQQLVARLRQRHPDASLTVRDLSHEPLPLLDGVGLEALAKPSAQQSAEVAARAQYNQRLIAELKAHDVVVVGMPMYNFGIPAQFKNWVDAVSKAGETFRYGADGPQGLLSGKTVYVALARGGIYRDSPHDFQVPYLRFVLAFMGITDVHFIYAEGLAMGEAALQKGLSQAQAEIEATIA